MSSRGNFDHHGLRWALGGSGYQFYTTSPTVQWAIDKKPETDFFPGGSSILVPTPTLVLNEQGFVDYEKTVIYAKAYGSTVERPNLENENKWIYRGPTPSSLDNLNILMRTEILPIKMAWQINGVPQYIYYDTLKIDIHLQLNKPSIKIQYALYNSWVQPPGQVYGQNAFFPNNFSAITDERYDTAPARLKKSMTPKAPDSDWFGRSCVQEAYGQRFVIMYDAEGFWYCWPENSDVDISPYEEEYKTYGDQSYKANLKNRVPRVGCVYPEWAHPSISHRDAYKSNPNKVILDPRYSWSFNSTGTRAIGVMIERKDSECKFYQTNYAPEGLDFGWNVLLNRTEDGEPYIPTEVEIDPILLDRSEVLGGTSDPQKTQEDRLGIVELSLTISHNGETGVFGLEVGVINEKSPDALIALNQGTIVDIAYVAPLDWSMANGVGESLVDDDFGVGCDDIVSVWIELYRHEEQKWVVAAFDGEPSKLVPSKTVASFYKGLVFDTPIFRLPLSQSHGKGYSYSRDPETHPAEPHLFVWNPNATLASRYPFKPKEGCSDTLYYYGAKLEQLDLSTLSFYYTVRVVAQKKADFSYSTYPEAATIWGEGIPGMYFINRFTEDKYSINTKARTYCAVCAMGRVVEEVSVGNEDISDSWILGWIRQSTKDGLNEGEEKINPDLKGNFEGIGVFPYDEWTIGYPAGFIPPSRNIDSGNYSWQCTNYSNFDRGSVPWWLLGACGHIVKTAITMSIIPYYDPTNYFEYEIWGEYGLIGVNTQTISLPTNNLWYYTKENIGEFAELIFKSSQLGRYTYTFAEGGYPIIVDGWGPYTKNPFTQARQGITLEDFVEQVKEYLWIIVKHVQDTTNKSVDILRCYDSYGYSYYHWNAHRSYNPGVMYFNIGFMSVLNEGGGLPAKKNGNVYTKDVSERVDKKITLKNFELGTLYYNTAISNHFYSSKMSLLSRIIVTPDGSISYLKKDVYEIKKEYAATAVVYQYSLNPYYTGEPTPIRLLIGDQTNDGYFIPDIELTADDIEWVLLDGLSWYYGRVKTKHLYVYNLAYQDKKNKQSLKHNESFVDKYSEADYKPDFRITEHGNMKWIYPVYSEDGYYKSLYHFSLPIGVEPNWNGNMTAPPNYHDPRQKITELRLSPIFF